MSDLENLWSTNDTKLKANKEFSKIPDGVYNASVIKVSLDKLKVPAKVDVQYRVMSGEFKNRVLFGGFMLNETGTAILKKEMSKLGYHGTPKNYDELLSELNLLVGKHCEVFVKNRQYTKKDGTTGHAHNVYVNGLLPADFNFDEDLPF